VAKKAIEDLELDVDEVLLMELIDYASKRGTVPAVQDLVAKALAEAGGTGGTGGMGEFHPRTSCINMFCVVYKVYISMDLYVFFWGYIIYIYIHIIYIYMLKDAEHGF
jgi:hypothetical protein